jgi:hypothetical protein
MGLPEETLTQRILRRIHRLVPPRSFRAVQEKCRGLVGIEVGGPSAVFERWNLWPLYTSVRTLDQYNFAKRTIWSGDKAGPLRRSTFGGPPSGRQLIGEASDMQEIAAASYDLLLASHVLEHLANPLKALDTWQRVVKPGGLILLVVPHRDGTFDHRRPTTSLAHIVEDFHANVGEDDTTHVEEILELHDLTRDPGAGTRDAFLARAMSNLDNRSLHHHVFDTELVLRVVDRAGLGILYLDLAMPYHICVVCSTGLVASRAPDAGLASNATFLSPLAEWRRTSAFPSDRLNSN